MLQDFLHAWRALRRSSPALGLMVLVLGTALGATTVLFSLVDAALIAPLPFPEPQRLVEIREHPLDGSGESRRLLAADFAELERQSRSFGSMAAILSTGAPITSLPEPMNPLMRRASAGYFRMLGVEPVLGRGFLPEEDRPGSRVVVLGHELWQNQLGGDEEVVGRTIELDHEAHTIVGVLPAGFRDPLFDSQPALWLPLALEESELDRAANRPLRLTAVFGRLADGVSLATARDEIERLGIEIATREDSQPGHAASCRSLYETAVAGYRPALLLLFAAVLLVLAVAGGNFAHLLLARALARRREIAVRLTLGARPRHLARMLLAEGSLLALACLAVGLGTAFVGLEPLLLLLPQEFGVPRLDAVALDGRAVAFAAVLALFCGVGFALFPLSELLRGTRATGALAERGVTGRGPRLLRRGLIVAEIALSSALLVSAGWAMLTLARLAAVPAGVEPAGVFTLRTSARGAGFGSPEGWSDFHARIGERLAALPGVESVGMIQRLAIDRPWEGSRLDVPGYDATPGNEPEAMVFTVDPGLFEALGMTLLRGRVFTPADRNDAASVVILGRETARRYFGDADPLGRTLAIQEGVREAGRELQVVGVVGDVRHGERQLAPRPAVYLPWAQNPMPASTLVLRGSLGDPAALTASTRRAILEVSLEAPVYDLAPLSALLAAVDGQPRFLASLLSGFALLALALAASGLYAVLSYTVAAEAREIGLRLALGARRSQVVGALVRQAAGLAVLGLGAGVPLSLAAGRWLDPQLLGGVARDPFVAAGVAFLVLAIALLASWAPARRAARLEPAKLLRQA